MVVVSICGSNASSAKGKGASVNDIKLYLDKMNESTKLHPN
jgi:hypothetical protein